MGAGEQRGERTGWHQARGLRAKHVACQGREALRSSAPGRRLGLRREQSFIDVLAGDEGAKLGDIALAVEVGAPTHQREGERQKHGHREQHPGEEGEAPLHGIAEAGGKAVAGGDQHQEPPLPAQTLAGETPAGEGFVDDGRFADQHDRQRDQQADSEIQPVGFESRLLQNLLERILPREVGHPHQHETHEDGHREERERRAHEPGPGTLAEPLSSSLPRGLRAAAAPAPTHPCTSR